jgi:hypothetical protein
MIQTVEVAHQRTDEEKDATVALEDAFAKAHRDFKQKGIALRAALMQFPLNQEAFDDAYAVWKQAQATVKAIEAAMEGRLTCAAFTGTACGRPMWNRHRDNDVVNRGRREERRTGVGQPRFAGLLSPIASRRQARLLRARSARTDVPVGVHQGRSANDERTPMQER